MGTLTTSALLPAAFPATTNELPLAAGFAVVDGLFDITTPALFDVTAPPPLLLVVLAVADAPPT